MRAILSRRPSPAMFVALVALVVAVGGTAVAGPLHEAKKPKRKPGDKIIKKRSLSGNRLKLGTITGAELNLAKLGKVPSSANADTLAGQPPTAFASSSRFVSSNGLVKLTKKPAPGNTAKVLTVGPFSIEETCTDNGGGVVKHDITITSTEGGTRAAFGAGGTGALTPVTTTATTSSLSTVTGFPWGAMAPSGASASGEVNIVENGLGTDCGVAAFGVG